MPKNIWDKEFDQNWRIVPVNCQVNKRGDLVMGAGLAKEAKLKYPGLDEFFGELIKEEIDIYWYDFGLAKDGKNTSCGITAFPTKYHWKNDADLNLIEKMANVLNQSMFPHEKFVFPKIGCGLGNLNWEKQVKPVLLSVFGENNPQITYLDD